MASTALPGKNQPFDMATLSHQQRDDKPPSQHINQWIPIDDHLPPEKKKVDVWVEYLDIDSGKRLGKRYVDATRKPNSSVWLIRTYPAVATSILGKQIGPVTHWMIVEGPK